MSTVTISLLLIGAGLVVWILILFLRRNKTAPKAPAKKALETLIDIKHTKPDSPTEAPKAGPSWLETPTKSPKKTL